MKKIIFPFLGICMFVLSGCFKTGPNVNYYSEEPAIVGLSDSFQPTLITQFGTFIAPDLQSKIFSDVMEGDALLTQFSVNLDQQPYTASDLEYFKIEKEYPRATTGGESSSDDYNFPIENMGLYGRVGNNLFFIFVHTAPADQGFAYEMTYDSELEDETIVVYIRARKTNEVTNSEKLFSIPFAFYMGYFFSEYKDVNKKVRITFRYKTGVDEEGIEKFATYSYYGNSVFEFLVD